MGCSNIGSGLYWDGSSYYKDAACSKKINSTVDTLSSSQLEEGINLESATDQENIDWVKALQSQAKGITSTTGTGLFSGKYGVLLIGGLVFVGVIVLWSFFGKGKK